MKIFSNKLFIKQFSEDFDVSSGFGLKSDAINNFTINNCKNMLAKSGTPDIKMSSTPGYLDLSPEKMALLICQTPIEELYHVEDQPFARGKYAAVRRCRHRVSGQQFAAKFLKKHRRSTDLRPEILHEVAILDACAGTTRIVKLHQVFESQQEMVLLLELASGGELQTLLDNDEVPEEIQVKRLMKQILDGLIYLHSINVAHLDIKPQNLVLTGEFPHCDVKLCDLGISRYISDGADIRDILGTPDYVAPEVLNYEPISLATDMWSVGVLLYVLLTGCSPFGGDTKQETFCNISQCNLDFPEDLFEEITEDAIDLMKKLMVKDPSKRLNAQDCLKHQWFTSKDVQAKTVQCSVKISLTKAQDMQPSPLPTRKLEQSVANAKASPKLKHRAPVETTITDKSLDLHIPELRVTKPPERPTVQHVPSSELKPAAKEVKTSFIGIKSSRRDNFKRNLSELAQRLSESSENSIMEETKVPKTTTMTMYAPVDTQKDILNVKSNVGSGGTMRKAKSMHLLPIDEKFDQSKSNAVVHTNVVNFNVTDVRRRAPNNRDCLYSFRKCIVIDDEDVSPPMSIAGSVTSSVYSDQSISDSGSEVSELSIDSSSDRSSIISLDDSLEYNTKSGRYLNHNIWNKRSSLSHNDSFANALLRFNSGLEDRDRLPKPAMTARRPARGSHTVALNKVPTSGMVNTCRLEYRKELYGNVVVIREVKAGKYVQVKEVKCDSLKARIRRLQDQGITET